MPEFMGKALGICIFLDLEGCNANILNNKDKIEEIMLEAAELAGANVVEKIFHNYNPMGTSGVVVIEESHFAIHTWPEHGAASIDVYTCGDLGCDKAANYLCEVLEAKNFEVKVFQRLKSEIPREHKIKLNKK